MWVGEFMIGVWGDVEIGMGGNGEDGGCFVFGVEGEEQVGVSCWVM